MYNRRSTNDKLAAGSRRTAVRLPLPPRGQHASWTRSVDPAAAPRRGGRTDVLDGSAQYGAAASDINGGSSSSSTLRVCRSLATTSPSSEICARVATHLSYRPVVYRRTMNALHAVMTTVFRPIIYPLAPRSTRWSLQPLCSERRPQRCNYRGVRVARAKARHGPAVSRACN